MPTESLVMVPVVGVEGGVGAACTDDGEEVTSSEEATTKDVEKSRSILLTIDIHSVAAQRAAPTSGAKTARPPSELLLV